MSINRLEDFKLWQEAMKLRKMVYDMVRTFPKEEKFITVHHLKGSARDAPGNIAEAFGRYHFLEAIHFYRIARGSVNEVKSDTYVALDEAWVPEKVAKEVIDQCDLVIKMLNSTIASSRKARGSY